LGFDNQKLLAANLRPQLTTVSILYFEMGSWAVRQLIDAEPNKKIRRGTSALSKAATDAFIRQRRSEQRAIHNARPG
jgi:DNA-binding LacI/PurR family transcriptional regulator